MGREIIIGALVVALSIPHLASAQSGLQLELGLLSHSGSYLKQVFSVKNTSAHTYSWIKIECGFFSDGRLIAADSGILENLVAGGAGFGQVLARHQSSADRADCRISEAR